LLNSVSVSIAASILVLPLVIYYFSSLSLIGPISNIIAVPLTSLAMVLGILAYLVHPVTTVLAEGYILLAHNLLQVTIIVNSFLLKLPFSSIQSLQLMVPVVVASCTIGYVVYSSTIRMLVFRVGIGSIIMVALIVSLTQQSTNFIIQHKHIQASFIKSTNNSSVLLLHDIKPVRTIYYDKPLTQYLKMQTTDSILVVSKGRQSEIVCDSLLSNSHCKNIKYVKL
ncbi:MAG: ComEC/Rec2 family competence protein, partial [Candidatus Kapabacteria bacterium]|nr:ComEC/Rec2 family competence protein [Candidatus Kapabacteria bacterium]